MPRVGGHGRCDDLPQPPVHEVPPGDAGRRGAGRRRRRRAVPRHAARRGDVALDHRQARRSGRRPRAPRRLEGPRHHGRRRRDGRRRGRRPRCATPSCCSARSSSRATGPSSAARPSASTRSSGGLTRAIRDATVDDLAAISAIYNATIPTTTAAWTEQPESLADRRRGSPTSRPPATPRWSPTTTAPSSASRPTATSGTRRSGPATATSSSSPSTSPRRTGAPASDAHSSPSSSTGPGRRQDADRRRHRRRQRGVHPLPQPARLPRGRPDAGDRRQVRPPARPGADATIDGGTGHTPVKTGSRLARNAAWPSL